MKSPTPSLLDASAVTLSSLCLLHCLALPLLASLLPLFGAWSKAEWVHVLFVALAAPLTGFALWRAQRRRPLPRGLWLLASAGLTGLAAGAAGWPQASAETPLTVAGSLMLAGAHLWNTARRHRVHD